MLSEKRSELWIGRDGGLVWRYNCNIFKKTVQIDTLFRYTVPGCYPENGKEVEVDIRSTHKAPRVNTRLAYEARGF